MRMEQMGDISRITIEAFTQLRCASSGQANETAELHMGRHTDWLIGQNLGINMDQGQKIRNASYRRVRLTEHMAY
ncbi:hypothetical protein CU665_26450 [Pseudomonas syringae pv. actinidifoliorum]|uniref:Uncharacterized protein n=1 Tax=Pseudomonas avellanae TaxID=46257 RepID=A0A3M5TMU2_9PSED|nr:hypothetical protein [Pseudomonas syringae pv. actinidifoliorum]NAT38679.1 hypothetical protein [Pseudomonas syringae pv. actinidifoliorum]RMU34257.1 hypothetical protein ALP32_103924 [Pseudomonas avellanae]